MKTTNLKNQLAAVAALAVMTPHGLQHNAVVPGWLLKPRSQRKRRLIWRRKGYSGH